MSTQSIITSKNLPTERVVAQVFTQVSTDLLKHLKYDVGCSNHKKMRDLLNIKKLFCNDFCFLKEDDNREIREKIIRDSINKIYEL